MHIDSRDGFAYVAKRISDKYSRLSDQFQQYSNQRNEFLETIMELPEMNHQESVDQGTLTASLHRTWMELKDELSEAVNVSAVIIEAQRGESYIKQAYESAIILAPDLLWGGSNGVLNAIANNINLEKYSSLAAVVSKYLLGEIQQT